MAIESLGNPSDEQVEFMFDAEDAVLNTWNELAIQKYIELGIIKVCPQCKKILPDKGINEIIKEPCEECKSKMVEEEIAEEINLPKVGEKVDLNLEDKIEILITPDD